MPILLFAVEVCPLSQSDIGSLDLAIFRFFMKLFQTNNREIINDCCYFLISNRQVNACITAKADLIGYTISLEVLTLTRCVNCRFALHHTTQIRSARWRRGMELMQNVWYGSIVWSMGGVGASMDVIEAKQSRGANLALIRNCECHKSSAWIVWQRSTVSRLVERMLPKTTRHVNLTNFAVSSNSIMPIKTTDQRNWSFDRIRQVAPICSPSNTVFVRPTRIYRPNGISVRSAMLRGPVCPTNIHLESLTTESATCLLPVVHIFITVYNKQDSV